MDELNNLWGSIVHNVVLDLIEPCLELKLVSVTAGEVVWYAIRFEGLLELHLSRGALPWEKVELTSITAERVTAGGSEEWEVDIEFWNDPLRLKCRHIVIEQRGQERAV